MREEGERQHKQQWEAGRGTRGGGEEGQEVGWGLLDGRDDLRGVEAGVLQELLAEGQRKLRSRRSYACCCVPSAARPMGSFASDLLHIFSERHIIIIVRYSSQKTRPETMAQQHTLRNLLEAARSEWELKQRLGDFGRVSDPAKTRSNALLFARHACAVGETVNVQRSTVNDERSAAKGQRSRFRG
eukprot:301004-Rhodomonas_salina.1